jgi:glycosyltransferase involved in cell wall biosynthesis
LAVACEGTKSAGQLAIDDLAPHVSIWSPSDRAATEAWRPDVCYLHGLTDPDAEAALAASVPTVLFSHNYHGTCISGAKRFAFPTWQSCTKSFGPGCLALYYPRRCGGVNPLTALRLYRLQVKRHEVFPRYRAVCVASRHMVAEFGQNSIEPERLHHLPIFTPEVAPDPTAPAPRPFSGRILMLGRLTELKGGRLLPWAARAAARRLGRELTLVVAGGGPDLPYIQRAAAKVRVPLEAVGWIGPEQRSIVMRSADLLAVPSTWPEPFGLVGIEAGCVGLPSVGFAVGGIPEWLHPGATGELAPGDPPTSGGLAEAIVRALRDPAHWQSLRVGAWKHAHEYSVNRHVERLEQILSQVCRESCGSKPDQDAVV